MESRRRETVLPGGENNKKFTIWLDKAANYLLSLKDKKGKNIPVLLEGADGVVRSSYR